MTDEEHAALALHFGSLEQTIIRVRAAAAATAKKGLAVAAEYEKFKQDLFTQAVDLYRQHLLPESTKDQIRVFLNSYYTEEAAAVRASIKITPAEIEASSDCTPLYWVLGGPEAPIPDLWWNYQHPDYTGTPRQADFDRRAAEWLRNVIIQKDSAALHNLAALLKMIPCPLYVGITAEAVQNSILSGRPLKTRQGQMWGAFCRFCDERRRLPSKKDLTEATADFIEQQTGEVAVISDSDFSKLRKGLGLSGLPQAKRGKAGF